MFLNLWQCEPGFGEISLSLCCCQSRINAEGCIKRCIQHKRTYAWLPLPPRLSLKEMRTSLCCTFKSLIQNCQKLKKHLHHEHHTTPFPKSELSINKNVANSSKFELVIVFFNQMQLWYLSLWAYPTQYAKCYYPVYLCSNLK